MFKLVISDDEGKTTVVPLVRDEISIGRQEGNTIRLTERNVSRRHAVLRRDAGGFAIEDLGSHNGVRINGRRIEGQAPLAAEDQVAIGDYVVTLHEEVAAGTAQAEADAPLVPPRLVMLTEPAPGAEFALTGDGQRIGRAEELDIWINHRSISREHAVVRVDGGVIRVVDLQSANGLRLNGKDTADAVLSAGDIIELGQVRFRFVGAGETFVFDPAEVAPVPAPERGASRLPLLLALLVIGGAIAFGVAYLSKEAPASTRPPEPLAPVGAERSADDEAAAAAARCEAARAEGRREDALVAAVAALELNPANAEAMACRAALGEAAEARARCLSVAEASRDDPTLIDQAYFTCADLADPGPEVLATRRAYAEAHLARGAEARAAGDRE
ncbi:MAG: FHA domain-containing protein, partial [Myxococcota bacterium]